MSYLLVEVRRDQLTMPLRIYARSGRLLISRHCLKEKVKDSVRLHKGFGNRSSTRGHNVRSTACSSLQLTKPHVHTAYFHFGIPSQWFESALLWSPAHSPASNLRERAMPLDAPQILSWSWTGLIGPFAYRDLLGNGYLLSHTSYYAFSPSDDIRDPNVSSRLQQMRPTTSTTLNNSTPDRLGWCTKE